MGKMSYAITNEEFAEIFNNSDTYKECLRQLRIKLDEPVSLSFIHGRMKACKICKIYLKNMRRENSINAKELNAISDTTT